MFYLTLLFVVVVIFKARERRDGLNPDYQSTDTLSATANYRAVGPTAEATYDWKAFNSDICFSDSVCPTS